MSERIKTYDDHQEGTAKLLEKNRKDKTKHYVMINGKRFVVYPNVFSPKYFLDTKFFARALPFKKESLLEIGPGSGVLSVLAALKGADVTAIDINPSAVRNTRENATLHRVNVRVLKGDVYSPLKKEKFDTIFWNTPFGLVDKTRITYLERAVFDPGYRATRRFVEGAPQYLKKNGKLLIGFSTTLGKFEVLKEMLHENDFRVRKLASVKSMETHPVMFELFEARLNKSARS